LFIADLHTLTSLRDGEQIRANTLSIAAAWLAFGFDTDKNYFYRQSKLAGYHTEIMWYLNCITPYPMLADAHSFKDKKKQIANVNAGLFTYPVLQAADIVLYDAEIIPVGKDQQQHIEMTRDMAGAFNRMAKKEIFVIPKAAINRPDRAGPTKRPRLKFAELRLTAFGTSALPTISEVKLNRAGWPTASAMPSVKARAMTCQICTLLVTTRIPSSSEVNPAAELVTIKTFRLLKRSAKAPPGKLTNHTGANCRAVTKPK
jgi:hypothetical protein